jgi:hypothetical protein
MLKSHLRYTNFISPMYDQTDCVFTYVIMKQTLQFHVYTNVPKVYRHFSFFHNAT